MIACARAGGRDLASHQAWTVPGGEVQTGSFQFTWKFRDGEFRQVSDAARGRSCNLVVGVCGEGGLYQPYG